MMAVAAMGPIPGMVISRRASSSSFARRAISRSSTAICLSSSHSMSTMSLNMGRAASGKVEVISSSSKRSASIVMCAVPRGATQPYSVKWPRIALISWVRWRTSRSRARNTTAQACASALSGSTKRMVGRCAASQIASASAASCFCRFTYGFT